MNPAGKQGLPILEKNTDPWQCAEIFKDIFIYRGKNQPGVDYGKEYDDNAKNVLITLFPELEKNKNDPAW